MRPTTTRVATPAAIAATSLVLNERCMIAGGPWLMRSVSKRRKQRRNAFLLGRIRQPPGGASRLQAQFNFACELACGCKTESFSVSGDVMGDLNEIRQTRNGVPQECARVAQSRADAADGRVSRGRALGYPCALAHRRRRIDQPGCRRLPGNQRCEDRKSVV